MLVEGILISLLLVVAFVAAGGGIATLRRSDDALRRLRYDPGSNVSAPSGMAGAVAIALPTGDDASSRLRRQLAWAGLRAPTAPQVFIAAKTALALVALVGFALFNASRVEPIRMALPLSVFVVAGGFFLPNLWLSARISDRQRKIDRALPDTLDLLVTCVEAGLGLDLALQRVSDEIAFSAPLLSSELRLAFLETKAGLPRMEALRRLAERTGSNELRSLAATLNQTEMFGTSVAAALRVQADAIRIRRMQRAEERAAYVAVKMTVPLVVCILPALFTIVVGPAIVRIGATLLPTLRGAQ